MKEIYDNVSIVDGVTGALLGRFEHVSPTTALANAPKGSVVLIAKAPQNFTYWSFDDEKFIEPDTQPTPFHLFNYETKNWEDSRNLSQLKEAKWTLLKRQRDIAEFGGFEFEGVVYDSDRVSQSRIMGAALAGVDQVWTLADNSTVSLTSIKLLELYQALQAHVASVHERGRIARAAIETASTKDEIESILL